MKLFDVTLIAVAGVRQEETLRAFNKCQEQIKFGAVKMIMHTDSYMEYNRYVFEELWRDVHTSHALVIQDDGYIINPELWSDDFLGYDYIGAPWPPKTHYTKDGVEIRVGNGGFSLRSRLLLGAPAILGLHLTDDGTGFFHEDGNICNYYRRRLEDFGMTFAPVDVAARFSSELKVPETVKSFGFHRYHP